MTTDYISRDDALDLSLTVECGLDDLQPLMSGMNLVLDHIRKLPAHTTYWEEYGSALVCHNCRKIAGKYSHHSFRYCPYCGAKVEADKDD